VAYASGIGLSRPTVPETIDEDADADVDMDDVEEGAADPTAQAIYNLVSGACNIQLAFDWRD
jgi:hypothetical protein